ncbi:MAG: hypothetical protein M5U01_20840 [Ardenticatenaceae bacterium]|nr:hypothetical protein [Ardenticatenaceae bacterium]
MADSRDSFGARWKRRIERVVEALTGVLRIPSPAPLPARVPERRRRSR